ncbi:substrate binding domain-containing protein [Agrobacterium larrymoorei]|uniref:substrate binding domain-containing protein n=1 Tax=Agrobacterium larrymoorei TaxID=160699 RepID=UPI0031F39863
MRPTIHGVELYQASKQAIASIDAAIEGVRLNVGEIEGTLRIHAPSCVGVRHIHKIVSDFQDCHAGVSIDLVLDDRTIDLVYDNFDLTLRYGKIEEQEAITRRIGWVRRILVTAPSYLSKSGAINSAQRLSELDVISTLTIISPRSSIQLINRDGSIEEVVVRPILRSNNAPVLIDAILNGRGVGVIQQNLVTDSLQNGDLVRVLPDFEVKPSEAFLAFPSRKFMRPAVRAFIDFAIPRLRSIDGITRTHDSD